MEYWNHLTTWTISKCSCFKKLDHVQFILHTPLFFQGSDPRDRLITDYFTLFNLARWIKKRRTNCYSAISIQPCYELPIVFCTHLSINQARPNWSSGSLGDLPGQPLDGEDAGQGQLLLQVASNSQFAEPILSCLTELQLELCILKCGKAIEIPWGK